jgi:hypothetical protein
MRTRQPRIGVDAGTLAQFDNGDDDIDRLPRIGTLARTRRLLLAALRVWELKNGIHD